MEKSFLRRSREDYIMDTIIYITVAVVFFACAYPFFFSVVLSFNNGLDAARGGIYFWPRKWTMENYQNFFSDDVWIKGIGLSAVRTLIGTVITTLFTALVAYGLSFRHLKLRKLYIAIIVFCMYFNGGLIPYYMVLKQLSLLNNFLVYIIPQALNLFYVIVAISFFQQIPQELYESAKLDGAGELRTMTSIIFPLSLPLLATIAIFSGVAHWSAWFDSAFFVQDSKLRTLGYLLVDVINKSTSNSMSAGSSAQATSSVTPLAIQATAMVIAVAPIMAIYPFMQRYFITGLTVGSVKG